MTERARPRLRASDRERGQKKRQSNQVAMALRDKILEGIERTIHLIDLIPNDRLDWSPMTSSSSSSQKAFDIGHLLGHLLDSAAGFCAVLFTAYRAELSEFADLREARVNHSCLPDEATNRLREYEMCISRGFEFCQDEDLSRKIPTLFTKSGERMITLLLGNFEHLTNHKHQLFFYLKQLGVSLSSSDLYQFRPNFKSKC